jgi:putative acetyltransferase
MIHCIRTNSDNPDFRKLVDQLDAELAHRDGAEHSFYAQFNALTAIRHVIVAYLENEAAGCGAIKAFTSDTMEVKRMFVPVHLSRKQDSVYHPQGTRAMGHRTGL